MVENVDARHAGRGGVRLRGEPGRHVRLRAGEPRVDEDAEVGSIWWRRDVWGIRELEEPGAVGIEVRENWTVRVKGKGHRALQLTIKLLLSKIHGAVVW